MNKNKIIDLVFQTGAFHYDEEHKIEIEHIGYENHFIDFNALTLHSHAFDEVARAVGEEINKADIEYDIVGGVPYIGAIFGYEIAKYLENPFFAVSPDAYWEKALPNKKLEFILLDDVSASGESLINSTKEIREKGHDVHHAFTFYDKNLWAKEKLKLIDVDLHSLFDLDTFLEIAVEEKYLGPEEVENIKAFNNKKRDRLKFSPKEFLESIESEKHKSEKAAELRREVNLKIKRDLEGKTNYSTAHPKDVHVPFRSFQELIAGLITPQEFEEKYHDHLSICKFCRESFEDCIEIGEMS